MANYYLDANGKVTKEEKKKKKGTNHVPLPEFASSATEIFPSFPST